ncbi:hypothetical protein ACHWQZ_G013202 [Mnemiopsis leidyi]
MLDTIGKVPEICDQTIIKRMAATSGQFLQSILNYTPPDFQADPNTVFEEDHEYYTDSPTPRRPLKPIEILREDLFPTVLPCIQELLQIVKQDKEYEREKLNSINWMVEYLYRNNPRYKTQRQDVELLDIPFVQKILAKRPQPPLPLHLCLTKNDAATLIQAGVRGYMARQLPEVQGFREKIRKKQAAATIIQSGWRSHKIRMAIKDEDLSNKDYCKLYYSKKTPDAEPAEDDGGEE